MLKKLRWRFIGVATVSVALVLLLLIVGINLFFRFQNDRNADDMLQLIARHEGTIPSYPEDMGPRQFGQPSFSPETPFDTRFFTVWLDNSGEIIQTQMEHIHAVTEANVAEYLSRAISSGKAYGYVEQYRFYRCEEFDQTLYVFLYGSL